MTKNPILNALAAVLYIGLVACIMYFGPERAEDVDSVLVPIAMLSLLSLSAAVMASVFFYRPIRMYLDGQKEDAARLLIGTIGSFALITVLLLAALFFTAFA